MSQSLKNTIHSNTYYGIRLWSSNNNNLTNNILDSNSDGIILDSSSNNNLTNNILDSNSDGIILDSSSNNNLTSNTGILNTGVWMSLSSSSNNSLINNTGDSVSHGIFLNLSDNNNLVSNTGNSENDNGIYLLSSLNNILISNTGTSEQGCGIYLSSSSNTTVIGGSYSSITSSPYGIQNSYLFNTFNNTGFVTSKKIDFYDNLSIFEYDNGTGVWLKTQTIVSPTASTRTTRTLRNWTQSNLSWSETWSAARTIQYNVSGLLPNTDYQIWNGSTITYNYTTDSVGILTPFTINFTTAAKTVKVLQATTIPTYPPNITSYANNYSASASFSVPSGTSVLFNATADQIVNWTWTGATYVSGNGTTDSNASKTFTESGTVTVSGTNVNGTSNMITWTITSSDITPPTITIISPQNQSYAQKWVWSNITLNEAGSWCGVSLNGTANQTLTNSTGKWWLNLSVPSEGSNNVKFWCNDTIGNMGNSSTTYFTVDTIVPTVAINTPSNNAIINYAPYINGTVTDTNLAWIKTNSTYYTALDQTSPFNFTNTSAIPDGTYTINVSANDSAGNVGWANVTFTVDTTYPQITFTGTDTNNSYKSRSWIWANVSLIDTNFKNLTFYLYNTTLVNATNYTDATRSVNWTGLADGVYYYNATAYDNAGNMNYTETRMITLDTVKPVIAIQSPTNTTYSTTTIDFNITGNEILNWSGMSLDGTANITLTNTTGKWWATNASMAQGHHTAVFYANDSAGNLNATQVTFTVDTTAPTINIINPANAYNTSTASISFSFNVTDNINASMACSLYVNGTSVMTNASTINATTTTFSSIAVSASLNQNWTVSCSDSVNSNTQANRTFNVDNVIPTSNAPADASYSQNASATIGWNLSDNYAGGYYKAYRNGTLQNQTTWQNNTALNVWVNTSTTGTWNYTIAYNDSLGNNGVPNTVIINITGDTTPKYSLNSTNSTAAGKSVKHVLYWIDDIQLSGYIFSFDNGNGTFYNDSWVAFTGIGNWTNVTKTVNSTIGANISWRVFANDTSNNWNASSVYMYNTTSCTESWSYSDWSACSSGIQTRTATDANTCGTIVNQSTLSQSCTSGTTTSSGGGGGGGFLTTTKTITLMLNEHLIKIVVSLKQSLDGPSITVAKVESVPVSAPAEPVYHYMNITKKNFNNSQIDNATIDFKVNKSWILENNFTKIYLARYENGWSKLKTDLVNSTASLNYYRAYTDAFSYFAIVGEKTEVAQTIPPVVEPTNETVEEQPKPVEQTEEPNAPVMSLSRQSRILYAITAIVLIVAVYAVKSGAIKKKAEVRSDADATQVKVESIQRPVPKIAQKAKIASKDDALDDTQRRLEALRKKLG